MLPSCDSGIHVWQIQRLRISTLPRLSLGLMVPVLRAGGGGITSGPTSGTGSEAALKSSSRSAQCARSAATQAVLTGTLRCRLR